MQVFTQEFIAGEIKRRKGRGGKKILFLFYLVPNPFAGPLPLSSLTLLGLPAYFR